MLLTSYLAVLPRFRTRDDNMIKLTARQAILCWSARRISVLLTIVALMLWPYSITQAKLNIGFYGLIHSLPVTFFVALVILIIASAILWTSPYNESKLLFTQLFFLITSLWLAPFMVGSTVATAPWIYEWAGFTEYICRTGHVAQHIILQQNWPGALILYSVVINVSGLSSPSVLIQPAPFVFQFVFLLFLYLFFKYTLSDNQKNLSFAGLFIFTLANWGPQTYLSSHTLAYAILLLMLSLLVKETISKKISLAASKAIVILLGAFVAVTHVVTSLMAIAFGFVRFVGSRGKNTIVVLFGIFVASWAIYVTTSFFESSLPMYLENALRLDIVFHQGIIAPRTIGNESRQAISQVKIVTTMLFLIVAFVGFLYSLKRCRGTHVDLAILGFSTSTILVAIIVGGNYTWELLDRIYLSILPGIAYFGIKLINSKLKALLCILLVVAIPLFFVSHYGSQISYHVSQYQFAAADFFEARTNEGELITWGCMGAEKNIEHYYRFSFIKLRDDDSLLYQQPSRFHYRYVEIGDYEARKMEFLYSDRQFVTERHYFLRTSPNYNLIYANPEVDLFVTEKQP